MKYFMFVCAVVFGLEIQAGECQNGRCSLRPVAPKVVQVTGDVVQATVQATKTVTMGTVRAVTPPYNCRRCRGVRCR